MVPLGPRDFPILKRLLGHGIDTPNDPSRSTPGPSFHPDQGLQYCSSAVREKLRILGMTQSMSRKGHFYDNAFAESFCPSLKTELDKERFESVEEARTEMFDDVNWYNSDRLHSSPGYMGPIEYLNEQRCAA